MAALLATGVTLGWLILKRAEHASNALLPFLVMGLPMLLAGFAFMVVVARLRRRKSSRTWELMLTADPNATHFIAFIYPPVKTQLSRLGWRIHGSSYLSIPAVGVSIGATAIKFWEAGVAEPTLTLSDSDIESAAVGEVSEEFRNHPAILLRLHTSHRSNRVQLNLRDAHHHNLSPEAMNEALQQIPMTDGFLGPEHKDR
ncbi:hypothetical protein AB4Y63_17160 [Leifsonia sp. YAF41]